ncbi:MAG: AAA family ATPase [Clostridia bacterium]|nr:AAA family ATPase [Clostridia bacterium]
MFVGREKELKAISEELKKPSTCVMIYGNRRVGKTTLLLHALRDAGDRFVYFQCYRDSLVSNIDRFMGALVESGVLDAKLQYVRFEDVFRYLNKLDGTINVVIDEYPFLKAFNPSYDVDGAFQYIVDHCLGNIRLFISGSNISMMRELTEHSNSLYGRFDRKIHLKEFDYLEAAPFYEDKTVYDKAAFYSVFGGSPYLNVAIDSGKTLKENITNIFLEDGGKGREYVETFVISETDRKPYLDRILEAAGNGKLKFSEIKEKTGVTDSGLFTRQLKDAVELGLLAKCAPINRPDDPKKAWYEISDNAMRFYYAYVYANKAALEVLGAEKFYSRYVEPSLTTFVSHRFEDICRSYFVMRTRAGFYEDVVGIGRYYYDNRKTKKSGEFDIVLEKVNGLFDVYEVKYHTSPITKKQMDKEIAQVKEIEGIRIENIGFVSISGFEDDCEGILIDGDELYNHI